MAIAENGILAMIKTFYAKDGVENLLYRNDPLLKMVQKERVEGKQQNISALYSRGGAVSANYLTAKKIATTTAQAKEFQVVPGQLFSCCSYNAKEILASKTSRGAYMKVAEAKCFANAESFRKTLAVALYGKGYGELFTTSADIGTAVTSATFPRYAVMGIDIGSELVAKASIDDTDAEAINVLTVTAIDGTTVTFTKKETTEIPSGSVICLSGCVDADGNPLLPVGLGGWLPSGTVAANDSFFGVNRSVARDRLAGSVISRTENEKKYEAIERGILALRRMGSLCDMIVMNDEDFLAMSKEIESKTYFTKVDGGRKGKSVVGREGFGFSVSTNWLENVIDSPYCPEGTAYILDSGTVKLFSYTNTDKVIDGITGNDAGKPEVKDDAENTNAPYQLLVDDLFSIAEDEDANGQAAVLTINFFGSFVVDNPSVNGVVLF